MCIGYNIRNNYWETLFQQGLKMLGINNTFNSYSSFDPMSMNRSLFNYNVNYDAMAGMAVANAVFGVAGQAYSTSRAEKQAEKQEYANNQTRLEQIENDINKQEGIKADKNSKIETLNAEITTANGKITNLNGQIDALKISNLQIAYNQIKNSTNPEDATKIDAAKTALEIAEQKEKELKKQIQAQQDIIDDINNTKLPECRSAINGANTEIANLKAEKEKLQKEVNSYEDSKVKTKLASSDEEYNAKIKDIKKYDDKNDDGSFTKKDVYSAIKRFIKAADGSPEKLKVAKELYYSHNHCGNDFDAQTIRYAQRAFDYINEYKKEA